jgi:hypothetical protein
MNLSTGEVIPAEDKLDESTQVNREQETESSSQRRKFQFLMAMPIVILRNSLNSSKEFVCLTGIGTLLHG